MLKRLMTTLFAGSLFSSTANADAMVWKVSNADGELYLGGTIHMLRPSDYPLKPEYNLAFSDSDVLVFETDVAATQDMGFQQKMMMQMSLPPGQTLQSQLSAETYQRLKTFAAARQLPLEAMASFKPSMVILTLTVMELQKLGITATSGIETYFSAQAKQHKKSTFHLETPDQQIALLSTMGDGYENEFVNGSLDDFETLESEFTQLITAWKNGDVATIDDKMTKMMKQRFPELYNSMLVQRNFNWITQIGNMIKTPEKEFILVGAAHLAGADSVQNLLKAQGYIVERVTAGSIAKK